MTSNPETDRLNQLLDPNQRERAYKELVIEFQKPLYRLIRNMVLSHDDAEDVLQNTFVKVFQNLSKFNGESKLYSWMYRIATNEALTHLQQKARLKHQSTESHLLEKAMKLTADPYFDGDVYQQHLQKAIAQLPIKQQLVFKMKYFEALKYEEMAEILDTSVGALKASYHHAVKKIEKYVASI
ncbi:MAG: RNA polymerase subunit sigma-70 [Flavobacterium sp. BFFFF2]|nr:MAG: RNA polymerase subunit sigma-70 [Flavobacterium sp. BFFFF2]